MGQLRLLIVLYATSGRLRWDADVDEDVDADAKLPVRPRYTFEGS